MWVKSFVEIALSSMVFEIQAFWCFAIFAKNWKIQNDRHFWRDKNFLKIGMATLQGYPKVKNSVEIALSSMVFEIQAFLCFAIFAKNWKIQNDRHFWRDKNFLKIGMATLRGYPKVKIPSKSLYLAWFSRYKHFYVLQFLQKIQKFKMAATFGETKVLKIGIATLQNIPCGSNILSKSLYLARFSRYKHCFVFSLFGKFAKINYSLITQPFLNQSMSKSNDFQILIE